MVSVLVAMFGDYKWCLMPFALGFRRVQCLGNLREGRNELTLSTLQSLACVQLSSVDFRVVLEV